MLFERQLKIDLKVHISWRKVRYQQLTFQSSKIYSKFMMVENIANNFEQYINNEDSFH